MEQSIFILGGSQGIPTGEESHNISEFNSESDVDYAFRFFIDDHVANCGYEDYLDDCDGDDESAFMEACADTGEHIIYSISPTSDHSIFDENKYVEIDLNDVE